MLKARSILNRIFFQDMTPIMDLAQKRALTIEDCQSVDQVREQILEEDDYPNFFDALKKLRDSPMKSLLSWESRSLKWMFSLHLFSVVLAVSGSMIAVQILSHINLSAFYALSLAALVFTFNITSAVLHSLKIEREMLILWRMKSRMVSYLYRTVTGISRSGRYEYKTGDILNVAQSDANTMATFVAHCFVDIPVLVLSLIIIVAALYSLLGWVAWLPIVLIALQIPLSAIFSWVTSLFFKEYMKRSDQRISLITEFIQGMRLVRYFGWGHFIKKDIEKRMQAQFRQEMKISAGFCLAFAQSSYWWMFVSLGVIGGLLFYGEGLVAEKVFGGIWLSSILNQQLTPLPWFVSSWASAKVSASRIQKLVEKKQQSELWKEDNSPPPAQGKSLAVKALGFQLNQVTLKFPDSSEPIFDHLSLTLPPAKTVAIIGSIGSGKSLLLQLLLGEIEPSSGSIELIVEYQDNSTKSFPLQNKETLQLLRENQVWVPQESFVVSSSIRENVPLSYKDHWQNWTDNEIMNALSSSQMLEDLKSIPGGLDAQLGERGINLSGGQKQRLSLSRSFINRKALTLLDDPFSAIDSNTEALIAPGLLKQQNTILWITHRYQHLDLADLVLLLDHPTQPFLGPVDYNEKRLAKFFQRSGHSPSKENH